MTLSEKQAKSKRTGGMAQVVECSLHVQGPKLNPQKRKEEKRG
jgi:hypothetical protein